MAQEAQIKAKVCAMKIIIAGDGKVGLALTRQLLHEGHEVTIVDSNPVVLQANMYQYDVMAVQGNAATMEALRQAQVERRTCSSRPPAPTRSTCCAA